MRAKAGPRTALITGASSGIGLELARVFAQQGWNLVIVGRNEERLEIAARALRSHGVEVSTIAKDLASPTAADAIFAELRLARVSVNALVNNAGFGVNGPFAKMEPQSALDLIGTLITSQTLLCRHILPGMLEAKEGRILNVACASGLAPGPLMAVYCAAKAYTLSFSEALASECRGTGVTVTTLCAGPTASEFARRAEMGRTNMFTGALTDPAVLAQLGYESTMKGHRVVFPDWKQRFSALWLRLLPSSLAAESAKKAHRRH